MAQRSTRRGRENQQLPTRLERAIAAWTRSANSIQASGRAKAASIRPDTRKHLNLRAQLLEKPSCIRRGVHTRKLAAGLEADIRVPWDARMPVRLQEKASLLPLSHDTEDEGARKLPMRRGWLRS